MMSLSLLLFFASLMIAIASHCYVRSTISRFSGVKASSGLSGEAIAKELLKRLKADVKLRQIHGFLTDHYDSRAKEVRLSRFTSESKSIAAISIAAHEVGHVKQDLEGNLFFRARHAVFPLASFGNKLAFPLIFLGFLFGIYDLIEIGAYCFAFVVLFHLVTLPVEIDASRKALAMLKGYLNERELKQAKRVLIAAALTYVAATAIAALQLLRLLIIARRRE